MYYLSAGLLVDNPWLMPTVARFGVVLVVAGLLLRRLRIWFSSRLSSADQIPLDTVTRVRLSRTSHRLLGPMLIITY